MPSERSKRSSLAIAVVIAVAWILIRVLTEPGSEPEPEPALKVEEPEASSQGIEEALEHETSELRTESGKKVRVQITRDPQIKIGR